MLARWSKRETQIKRDTKRLAILDVDAHNKLEEHEKMANLLKAESMPVDSKFRFFSSGNDYKVHNKKISLSVEAQPDSYFKIDFPEVSNREYFQITLFCPLWVPTRIDSKSTMMLYIKDSAYLDPAAQRTLLGKFPVSRVTSIVWRMSHHLAVSDADMLSLHIHIEDLDVHNTVMGTLRLAYVIRFADECLPSKPILPGMVTYSLYEEEDYTEKITNAIVLELINLYESKTDDFASSFKKVVEKFGDKSKSDELDLNKISKLKVSEPGATVSEKPDPFEVQLMKYMRK